MKKICSILITVLLCIPALSQVNIKAGITGNFAFGDMSDYFIGGPGAEASIQYLIKERIGIGVTSGFQHFFAKEWEEGYDDIGLNIIPLRLSLSCFLGENNVRPYFGCELGLNFTDLKYTYYFHDIYNDFYTPIEYDNSYTRFGFAGLIGFQVDLGSSFALDLNTKINMLNDISNEPTESVSYAGLNIGLVFKIE